MRDVNKNANTWKTSLKMSGCREISSEDSPRYDIMTTFIWNYVFLNNSGASRDFKTFFFETTAKMFEFSLVK